MVTVSRLRKVHPSNFRMTPKPPKCHDPERIVGHPKVEMVKRCSRNVAFTSHTNQDCDRQTFDFEVGSLIEQFRLHRLSNKLPPGVMVNRTGEIYPGKILCLYVRICVRLGEPKRFLSLSRKQLKQCM